MLSDVDILSNHAILYIQFDEQRDQVAAEQILRVVFIYPERPTPVRLIYFERMIIMNMTF